MKESEFEDDLHLKKFRISVGSSSGFSSHESVNGSLEMGLPEMEAPEWGRGGERD